MNHRMPNEDFAAIQAKYLMQCWSAQRDYAPLPVKATSGCWIHTTDGRKIFDLRSARMHQSGLQSPQGASRDAPPDGECRLCDRRFCHRANGDALGVITNAHS
jgi:hypothetical protein